MALTEQMRQAAHTMLDAVLMQTGDGQPDEKRDGAALALRRLYELASDWITVERDAMGQVDMKLYLDPLIYGSAAVMLWAFTELAACAGITEEEVIAHARNYVDAEARRPPR